MDHSLSPPSVSAGAIVCGFAALIGLIGFVRPVANERRIVNHTVSRAAAQRVAAVGSMVLALAVVGAILAPPTLTTVALIIAAFCGGLALYAPVAILALSGAPAPVGRRLAAIRALGANSRGFAIHVGVTTCLVGLVASTLALLTGLLANLNRNSGTGLPAGIAMVNVRDEGKVPLSADVVGRFRSDLRLGEPVDVWRGVDENAKTQDQTPWWTFRSVADARRLLPWIGDDQARTLEASARLATVAPDERPRPDAVALPWAMRWLAEIRIAASPPPGTFSVSAAFAGLSREQDIAASRWASANGVADGYIWTAEVEPEVPLTTITAVSTVAFATLAAIMGAVAVRGEVAAMRGVLAGFHAMGLGARWCRQVIVLISTLAAGLAVIAGLLAAVLGVLASNYVLGGGVLIAGIPWHLVVMVCLGTLLGGAVGGAASSFRFGAQEHNTR